MPFRATTCRAVLPRLLHCCCTKFLVDSIDRVTYHPKPAIGYRVKPSHLSGDDIVLQHGATGVTKAATTIIATEPAAT